MVNAEENKNEKKAEELLDSALEGFKEGFDFTQVTPSTDLGSWSARGYSDHAEVNIAYRTDTHEYHINIDYTHIFPKND